MSLQKRSKASRRENSVMTSHRERSVLDRFRPVAGCYPGGATFSHVGKLFTEKEVKTSLMCKIWPIWCTWQLNFRKRISLRARPNRKKWYSAASCLVAKIHLGSLGAAPAYGGIGPYSCDDNLILVVRKRERQCRITQGYHDYGMSQTEVRPNAA